MIWSATTRAFNDVTLRLKSVAATARGVVAAWEVTTTARVATAPRVTAASRPRPLTAIARVAASVTSRRRSTATIQVTATFITATFVKRQRTTARGNVASVSAGWCPAPRKAIFIVLI